MISNTEEFDVFVGREVSCAESEREVAGILGTHKFTEVAVDDNDPVMKEVEAKAADDEFTLRVWLPTTLGTMDWNTNRLNVYIEKNANGKYVISRFNIG